MLLRYYYATKQKPMHLQVHWLLLNSSNFNAYGAVVSLGTVDAAALLVSAYIQPATSFV
jgi:hypothetical protein